MPELNSIRGLACLAVLFCHGLWWNIPQSATGIAGFVRAFTSQGFRGVTLFFVLSGMLITGILRDSKDRPDYFQRFYKRRALRILPVYYVMIVLLALWGVSAKFLCLSLLHIANMAPMLGIVMGYGPFWSLAVEEQFYMLWPWFVRKFSNRIIATLPVGLFVNSFVLALGLRTDSPHATYPIWYAAHALAVGDLLALYLRSSYASRSHVGKVAATLSLIGWVSVWLSRSPWFRPQVGLALQCGWDLVFAGMLLFALLAGTSRFAAWTRPKWLQFFGDISYGLYLVHVLVFKVYVRFFHSPVGFGNVCIEFVICAGLSIVLATVSRFTFEEWFMAWKDRSWLPLRRMLPNETLA
jgi:peptidoglycan/LPS O-acetylase OafA/YrhL